MTSGNITVDGDNYIVIPVILDRYVINPFNYPTYEQD